MDVLQDTVDEIVTTRVLAELPWKPTPKQPRLPTWIPMANKEIVKRFGALRSASEGVHLKIPTFDADFGVLLYYDPIVLDLLGISGWAIIFKYYIRCLKSYWESRRRMPSSYPRRTSLTTLKLYPNCRARTWSCLRQTRISTYLPF